MILLAGIVVGLVVGLLTGGSLHRFASNRLRFEGIFGAALVLYVMWPVVAGVLGLGDREFLLVWLASAAALVGLALVNLSYSGMVFVSVGLAMNILVVAMNGGMPVELKSVGLGDSERATEGILESPLHVEADQGTQLSLLGDVIYIPGPTGFRTLVSIGDILLAAGAGVVVFQMMKRSDAGASQGATASEAADDPQR